VLDHIKDKVSADERPKLLKVLETKWNQQIKN
jgi:hypothetical protein